MQPQVLGSPGYTVRKRVLRQELPDDCLEIFGLPSAGRRFVSSHPAVAELVQVKGGVICQLLSLFI